MKENLLPCDGSMILTMDAVPQADAVFDRLMKDIDWQAETIKMFGKPVTVPRLVAWHGDASYTYSGVRHEPADWTQDLLNLKAIAERLAGTPFNSVLLNLYRDGSDGMGWHADDEPELGPDPVIASISLGVPRLFHVKHRRKPDVKHSILLPGGSCLVMAGGMQSHWLHRLAKTARPVGARINLTFRGVGATNDYY
jgi:alkylated DNA repair dioxygenase AlkB